MTEIKNLQNKGQLVVRQLSAFSTVLFGFLAIFFVTTPKVLNEQNNAGNTNFFFQEVHADVVTGDSAGCASDSAGGTGCAGACADGSAGGCSCGDGGGCGACGSDGACAG